MERAVNTKLNTFQQVRELPQWQAVAFAAALMERMLPNYQLFCEATEFGDPEQFRNSLSSVWEWLSVPKAKINFQVQLDKIEEATPDAADFDNFGVYPAIDAAISLASTLMLIIGDEPQGAVIASKLSQGTVEAFIEATAEAEVSAKDIKAHPLMAWEVSIQQEVLAALQGAKRGAETCKTLKAIVREEGMSNIGVEF